IRIAVIDGGTPGRLRFYFERRDATFPRHVGIADENSPWLARGRSAFALGSDFGAEHDPPIRHHRRDAEFGDFAAARCGHSYRDDPNCATPAIARIERLRGSDAHT